MAKIPGAEDPQLAVNAVAAGNTAQGLLVAVGSANGYPAAWVSADGGSAWTRAAGAATRRCSDRPGIQQLTSVTYGAAGWLAVGGVTAAAPEHPVVLASATGTRWTAADGQAAFSQPGLVTEQAAAGRRRLRHRRLPGHRPGPHHRGGLVVRGPDRLAPGRRRAAVRRGSGRAGRARVPAVQMRAVTASPPGVHRRRRRRRRARRLDLAGRRAPGPRRAVPRAGRRRPGRAAARREQRPAPWWRPAPRPPPPASSCRSRRARPTAAPPGPRPRCRCPPGRASLTALTAAGGGFWATGTFGTAPGHQDVVVWTSPQRVGLDRGHPGRAGPDRSGHPGHHRPDRLRRHADRRRVHRHRRAPSSPSSGSPGPLTARARDGPGRWRPLSPPATGAGGPNTSSRWLARLGTLARTVSIRPRSTSATATPGRRPEVEPDHAERVDQHAAARPRSRPGSAARPGRAPARPRRPTRCSRWPGPAPA